MAKRTQNKSRQMRRTRHRMKAGTEPKIEETDELDISFIPDSEDDEHELDESFDFDVTNKSAITTKDDISNMSISSDMSSLHLSDLAVNQNQSPDQSFNTTIEDESMGGKKRRTVRKRTATKKRKTMKKRKATKKRRIVQKGRSVIKSKGNKKQSGGTCYGSGVGANSYDPNFSIYNTRELQLFPYNPK